jgi:Holliday junction resolvase RusA-like endonuclease
MVHLNIKPKPTPRPRVKTVLKEGKRINCTYYPEDYQKYKDELCNMLKSLNITSKDYCKLYVVFGLPYPKNVVGGNKNKIESKLHKQKPDLDNLLKGLKDGLTQSRVLATDDSTICIVYGSKLWTNSEGYIEFLLEI